MHTLGSSEVASGEIPLVEHHLGGKFLDSNDRLENSTQHLSEDVPEGYSRPEVKGRRRMSVNLANVEMLKEEYDFEQRNYTVQLELEKQRQKDKMQRRIKEKLVQHNLQTQSSRRIRAPRSAL
jgi:hypothetical protein